MRELNSKSKPIAIALGYFDCVHFAHRKIINHTVSYAQKNQLKSAVFTFSNDLYKKGVSSIYTFKERKRLIEELDSDYIISLTFDNQLKNMSKEEFLDLITEKFDIRYICCGSDYRFGVNSSGDTDFLTEYANKKNIGIQVFKPISIRGEIVSTSLIKDELQNGNLEKVNKLLCSPYSIEGRVSIGKGRGQGLGFPTANLKPKDKFLPKFGVYKSRTFIDDKIYPSITSIGSKPTFDDESITIETFILGNVFNLYAKNMRVELLDFIRDIIKFSSAAQLKEQIKQDILRL